MKNRILLVLLSFLAIQLQVNAQSCVITGAYCSNTPGSIPNANPPCYQAFSTFPSGCQYVNGSVLILPTTLESSTDITSLQNMSNVRTISGDLRIDKANLTNLDALSNLTSVGGSVYIHQAGSFTNLNGLRNLVSVGGDIVIDNIVSLTDVSGLNHPITIGGTITFRENWNLQSCDVLAVCSNNRGVFTGNATGCNGVDVCNGGFPNINTISSLPYNSSAFTCEATSIATTQSFMPVGQTWDGREAVFKYGNTTGQDQVIYAYYTGQNYSALVAVDGANNLREGGSFLTWTYTENSPSTELSFLLPANHTIFLIVDTRNGVASACPGTFKVFGVPLVANNRYTAPLSISPATTCQNTAVNCRAAVLNENFGGLTCTNTMQRKLWYRFTATNESCDFTFSNFNGTGFDGLNYAGDIQMVVLNKSPIALNVQEVAGSCQSFHVNSFSSPQTRTVTGLTIGTTYTLALTGGPQLNFDLCLTASDIPIVHWKKESLFPSGRLNRNWTDVNNWVEGRLPTALDSVVIEEDAGGLITIEMNQNNITTRAISVNGAGSIRLSSSFYTGINLGDYYAYSAGGHTVQGATLRNVEAISVDFFGSTITGNVHTTSSIGFIYSRLQAGMTIDNAFPTNTMIFENCEINANLTLDNKDRSFFYGTFTGTGSLTFDQAGKLIAYDNTLPRPHLIDFNIPVYFDADVYIEAIATDWIINFNRAVRLNGIITIDAETHFNSTLDIPTTTRLRGGGTLYLASTYVNRSILAPGSSPGTLVINPSVTNDPTGVMEMEIIGNYGMSGIADDADKLESEGNIALDGTLKLILDHSAVGTYTIFNSTTGFITGTFATILYSVNGGAFTASQPSQIVFSQNANTIQITVSAVLPVELLDFKAQNREGSNLLTWATATERNTRDFDIEQSSDGKTFTRIGNVKAKGNSQTPQYYRFSDDKFFDLTYYRLKINDLDNKSAYSKVESVTRPHKGFSAKAYPNPFNNDVKIEFSTDKKTDVQIELVDILGRQVFLSKVENTEGGIVPLAIGHLSSGAYLLKVSGNQQTVVQRLIKK